jgi:SRSO17 transposase
MALTQVRTALKAGFQIEGVVADADYGSTADFRT